MVPPESATKFAVSLQRHGGGQLGGRSQVRQPHSSRQIRFSTVSISEQRKMIGDRGMFPSRPVHGGFPEADVCG